MCTTIITHGHDLRYVRCNCSDREPSYWVCSDREPSYWVCSDREPSYWVCSDREPSYWVYEANIILWGLKWNHQLTGATPTVEA